MNKLLSLIYSTRVTAVLFLVFAAAMGVATFIENDYGTETAKALVYNAWWFEAIMAFFAINFFGNIFKYKLYKKEKLWFHEMLIFVLFFTGYIAQNLFLFDTFSVFLMFILAIAFL